MWYDRISLNSHWCLLLVQRNCEKRGLQGSKSWPGTPKTFFSSNRHLLNLISTSLKDSFVFLSWMRHVRHGEIRPPRLDFRKFYLCTVLGAWLSINFSISIIKLSLIVSLTSFCGVFKKKKQISGSKIWSCRTIPNPACCSHYHSWQKSSSFEEYDEFE